MTSQPFAVTAAPPVLGARQRALVTALGQRRGQVLTRAELADALDIPVLTPRRSGHLVAGINAALGDGTVVEVPRRGLRMNRDVDAPVVRSL